MYIIEDLQMSYENLEDYNARTKWPGMQYNDPEEDMNNSRKDMDEFFRRIIFDLDYQQGEILTIHFWSNMCVITKAGDGSRLRT